MYSDDELRDLVRGRYPEAGPSRSFTDRIDALQSRRSTTRRRWAVLGAVAAVTATTGLMLALPQLGVVQPAIDPAPATPFPAPSISSSVQPTDDVSSVSGAPLPTIDPAQLEAFAALDASTLAITLATDQLVADCARTGGFEVLPDSLINHVGAELIDEAGGGQGEALYPSGSAVSPDPTFASEHGYGFVDTQRAQPAVLRDANDDKYSADPFLQQSQQYRQEFSAYAWEGPCRDQLNAMFGPESAYPPASSRSAADRVTRAVAGPENLADLGGTPVGQDWIAAVADWTTCMDGSGYSGFTDPVAAIVATSAISGQADSAPPELRPGVGWVPLLYGAFDDPNTRDFEISLAVADARCASQTDLNAVYREALAHWRTEYWKTDRESIEAAARHMVAMQQTAAEFLAGG